MKNEGNELLKESIKVKNKLSSDIRIRKRESAELWKKTRKKYLEEKGWSLEYYKQEMKRKGGLWMETEEINRCQERQKIEEKLRKSKFAEEYREIVPDAMKTPENKTKEMLWNYMPDLDWDRETRANRYWERTESADFAKRKRKRCSTY